MADTLTRYVVKIEWWRWRRQSKKGAVRVVEADSPDEAIAAAFRKVGADLGEWFYGTEARVTVEITR